MEKLYAARGSINLGDKSSILCFSRMNKCQPAKKIKLESVNPKPSMGFASKVIDVAENLIVKFLHHSSQTPYYLSGNFAPIRHETPPVTDIPVTGSLPECLNGEFFRVGPNPKFDPIAGFHWFDGDGMIHGMRFKDGKAAYVSRYVNTSRLKQEEFFGAPKFLKVGDLHGIFGLLMIILDILRKKFGVLDDSCGCGPANTALAYHNGRLLALHEADKPYVVRILEDGDLQTLGILDYEKKLNHSFTAHPKIDPITGEMFLFGSSPMESDIVYRVISKDGIMQAPVPITIPEPVLMHDFAITENYAVFMDLPMFFKPMEILNEKKFVYSFDSTRNARFGVLPRYAKNDLEIRWFELPSCFIFHIANAWEEDDEVVLMACRLEKIELETIRESVEEQSERPFDELYEMRFNMVTGEASQKRLSSFDIEFPRINHWYTGRKQRYIYATATDRATRGTHIIKFDLNSEPELERAEPAVGGNINGVFEMGPKKYGSEAVFIPRMPGYATVEDDGYLIFFMHDENTGKSSLYVIDAKTMSKEPVAVIGLPHRVPYGFHALFVDEAQLMEQAEL